MSYPSRLVGGPYDGDKNDLGDWPPYVVAFDCLEPLVCGVNIHWWSSA